MWQVFGANTLAQQSLFQSGWFVVGLLTQTLVVHMLGNYLSPSGLNGAFKFKPSRCKTMARTNVAVVELMMAFAVVTRRNTRTGPADHSHPAKDCGDEIFRVVRLSSSDEFAANVMSRPGSAAKQRLS